MTQLALIYEICKQEQVINEFDFMVVYHLDFMYKEYKKNENDRRPTYTNIKKKIRDNLNKIEKYLPKDEVDDKNYNNMIKDDLINLINI